MTVREHLFTMAEFKTFVERPENAGQLFELMDGEIIEVSPGRTRNSGFGHLIAVAVHNFCREHNIPCYTSGGDGAYDISGNAFAPDFAYKQTPLSDEYPDPDAPLWVVEIISPTDKADEIRRKRDIYIKAGILLWEMYPKIESIDVYAPGKPMRTFGIDDVLDGSDILPAFRLPVKDLFG